MKKCSKCKRDKSLEEFYNNKSAKDGKESWCKPCIKIFDHLKIKNESSERRKQRLERHKKWREDNKEYRKSYRYQHNLLSNYGLSLDDYEELQKKQNFVCAICKKEPIGKPPNGKLHVDHCHETNRIRGLLCSNCNKGIGIFYENVDYLKSAINYLELNNV